MRRYILPWCGLLPTGNWPKKSQHVGYRVLQRWKKEASHCFPWHDIRVNWRPIKNVQKQSRFSNLYGRFCQVGWKENQESLLSWKGNLRQPHSRLLQEYHLWAQIRVGCAQKSRKRGRCVIFMLSLECTNLMKRWQKTSNKENSTLMISSHQLHE